MLKWTISSSNIPLRIKQMLVHIVEYTILDYILNKIKIIQNINKECLKSICIIVDFISLSFKYFFGAIQAS